MHPGLFGRVTVQVVEIAQDGNPISPRVFEVDSSMPVPGDNEREALVEPPV